MGGSCSSSSDSSSFCEGDNPFHASNGSAERSITDLKVAGLTTAEKGLSWKRYHATKVQRDTESYFGGAGTWRHSWQYDLYEIPAANGSPPSLVFVRPDGTRQKLMPTANGQWSTAPGLPETAAVKNGGIEVKNNDGVTYFFARIGGATEGATGNRYQMTLLTNADGLATTLQYDQQGWLTNVTEPGGRSLALSYRDIPTTGGSRLVLATVQQAPAPGQWVEYTVPAALRNQLLRHLRFRAADATAVGVAEVQFFAPGSTQPLTGKITGSNPTAQAAFDGDSSTSFVSTADAVGYCGVDLGNSGSTVARVRILAQPGQEAALANGVFEAYTSAPTNVHVLTQVQVSDGRTVTYDYDTVADKLDGLSYVGLSAAHYGDSTSATYRYGFANDGSTPLLTDANDPRYDGRLKHVRYAYHAELFESRGGAIHQEVGGDTGAVLSSLEFDSSNPNRRIVNYGDLRTVTYTVAESTPGEFQITAKTDSLGRIKHYEYANSDSNSRPVVTVDHAGRRTERTRDDRGHLLKLTRNGKTLKQITRDADGHILTETGRDGFTRSHTLDKQGRRIQSKQPDGSTTAKTFDALGNVATETLPTGGSVALTHDSRGLLTAKVDANGRKTTYAYDKYDRLASETDALGRTTLYQYNDRGLKTAVTYPTGLTELDEYDQYGRLLKHTDQQGRANQISYDELGRTVRQVDNVGRVTTYEYAQLPDSCGCSTFASHPTKIVLPDGSQILRLYDTEGRLLTQTIAAGTADAATTVHTYDQDNNLTSSTDPLGRITRFTYDDQKRRLSATDPLGRTTRWSYNDAGDVAAVTGPDGNVTTKLFDAQHRVTQSTDAARQATVYAYDATGNMVKLTDAAGQMHSHTYDAGGQRTSRTDPDGKKQTWEYDEVGRMRKTVSPDGLAIVFTYDAGNRVLSRADTLPDGSARTQAFAYDSMGHRTSATDALGRTTGWTYDARGNVLSVTPPGGTVTSNTYDAQNHLLTATDANGATTTYTYDAGGNQVSLTDANGHTYRVSYDALQRKTAMVYPDGSKEAWVYNSAGQLVNYTNRAGQTKTLAYNAGGQPVSETWSPAGAAPNVAYVYDAAGHLLSANNGQAKLTYTYDVLGRIASETSDLTALVPGLDQDTMQYRYDELGRRTDLIYPDQTKVSYTYDARSRLITVDNNGGGHTPLATYDYDSSGQIDKLTRDNGVATAYTYDMTGRLTDITHASGGFVLASSHYTLNQLGRRTAQSREDGITETYGYDATSQLTTADYGTAARGKETFAYDPVGNRTEAGRSAGQQNGAATTKYKSNALNQYTQTSTAGVAPLFTYDANGNLTNDGQQVYAYDAQNRLISVASATVGWALRPDSVRAEFFYDARNRCMLRKYYTLGGQSQWMLNQTDSRALTYDTGWKLLAERQLNGTQVGEYIHGQRADEILRAEISNPANAKLGIVYPLADGLGSTVALSDEKGKIIERVRYDIFGAPQVLTLDYNPAALAPSTYRFLFTGREWLASVNLNDHRNRYYSPSLGRWLNTDPVKFGGRDSNLYRYAQGNPILQRDPSGLLDGQVIVIGVESVTVVSTAAVGATVTVGTIATGTIVVAGGAAVLYESGRGYWQLGEFLGDGIVHVLDLFDTTSPAPTCTATTCTAPPEHVPFEDRPEYQAYLDCMDNCMFLYGDCHPSEYRACAAACMAALSN